MNDLSNIIIEKNQNKRERKHNAIKLPTTLADFNLPKYINYYKECYNNERKLYREYFKIEKHPYQQQNKTYISSKSNKISIIEKLNQITKILDELNTSVIKNNTDDSNIVKLPKYISIKKHDSDNTKFYLVYDKKTSNRNTLQELCYKSDPFSHNLNNFLKKIIEKFDI